MKSPEPATVSLTDDAALAAMVAQWRANIDATAAIATRRGWAVEPFRATKPATARVLKTLEKDAGMPLPKQLQWLLQNVSAEWQFGWRSSPDDEPRGQLGSFYSGGIRDFLWSAEHIEEYAIPNFFGWREYYFEADADPDNEYEEPNPREMWNYQFAIASLPNGDMLTIEVRESDAQRQPVRYFSHEIEGAHGRVIAPDLFSFLSVWTALGCVGGEQHTWLALMPKITRNEALISVKCAEAKAWLKWLCTDPNDASARGRNDPPRLVLARTEADIELLEAAKANKIARVKKALDAGANPDCTLDDSDRYLEREITAIMHAANHGNIEMMQLLKDRGASLATYKLPLAEVIQDCKADVALWLIENGARIDPWTDDRFCALHSLYARDQESDPDGVEYFKLLDAMLAKGCDPNAPYDRESTAATTTLLMRAGAKSQARLLKAGANPHLRDLQGRTAIYYAWSREQLQLLMAHGLDINDLSTPADKEDCSVRPLQYQLGGYHEEPPEVITDMLELGADPHLPDGKGRSAWFWCEHPETAQMLIDRGFDVNAKTPDGQTWLHRELTWSSRLYDWNIGLIALIVQHGYDINATDNDGNTGLHLMAAHVDSEHDVPSVKGLLKHGADIAIKNNKGKMPFQCLKVKFQKDKALQKLLKP